MASYTLLMNFKKLLPFLLIIFTISVLVLSFVLERVQMERSDQKVLQSQHISFEIADTTEKREQGLSGRTDIPHDYGMLFIFPKKGDYGFWMKDMKEPIDILWLDDNGEILKIDASVSPDTYPTAFHPPVPVRHVLEMRAGESALKGFFVGSRITLPLLK